MTCISSTRRISHLCMSRKRVEPWQRTLRQYMTVQCGMQRTRWVVQVSVRVLTAVPHALLNPTHPSSSPSVFHYLLLSLSINALVFFFRSFFIPHPPPPPLPSLSPSVFLSEWPQQTDVSISDHFSALGLCAVLFLMRWDSEILKCMRSHMLAGEMD